MTSLLVFLFGCFYGEGTLDLIDVYDYQVSAITERCGDRNARARKRAQTRKHKCARTRKRCQIDIRADENLPLPFPCRTKATLLVGGLLLLRGTIVLPV